MGVGEDAVRGARQRVKQWKDMEWIISLAVKQCALCRHALTASLGCTRALQRECTR